MKYFSPLALHLNQAAFLDKSDIPDFHYSTKAQLNHAAYSKMKYVLTNLSNKLLPPAQQPVFCFKCIF